jgi:hypothetical protein
LASCSCVSIRALLLVCFLISVLRCRFSLFCYQNLHRLSWPCLLIRLFCLPRCRNAALWLSFEVIVAWHDSLHDFSDAALRTHASR